MTVDPTQGGQQAALGNFLSLLGITLILATDLHHLALDGLGAQLRAAAARRRARPSATPRAGA